MIEYVFDLRPADVLFGRGSGPNDHEGNVRFRQLVADRKAEYLATNHRMTKAKIAREIVDQVFAQQGRFLKKVEAEDLREAGFAESTDVWVHVDQDTIMEKAKQALRQNTNKKGAASTPSPQAQSSASMAQHGMMGQNAGTTLSYTVEDLEPIPITPASESVLPHAPGHMSRPSQLAMPPPSEINTAWAMEQQRVRQQRMLQLQQQQQNLQPDTQYSAYSEQDPQEYTDGNNNNMGYSMPSDMTQPSSQRRPSQDDLLRNEPSLYRLPSTDEAPVRNSLRGSLNVPEGFDRESMDITQLMDSFRSTKIGEGEGRKMMSSTDTMGTIEPITGAGSVADMSIGMNSSTFSILRGDESWDKEKPTTPAAAPASSTPNTNSNSKLPPIGSSGLLVGGRGLSESSFTFSELTSSNRSGSGNNRRASATSQSLAGVKEEGNFDTDPLPVDVRVSLGSSSLSYLKGMVLSSTDDVLQQSMNSMSTQQQQEEEQQSEYTPSYQEQHQQQQQQQKPPSY